MSKTILIPAVLGAIFLTTVAWSADIYRVVDKDGNVIYTDQPPGDGSSPMVLPELSVVETVKPVEPSPADIQAAAEEEETREPTASELRRMYSDFRIIQPQSEETFWGTANSVVVSWGSEVPPAAGMKVLLHVDGKSQPVPGSGSVSLVLDRGEHSVYAELLDARNRRIVASRTVTFFVKQHSANFNGTAVRPIRGS